MANSKLIITSIAGPNKVLKTYAQDASVHGFDFVVIGDKKSPSDFHLDQCDFWSVDRQLTKSNSKFARLAPLGHYARKNLGYILAARTGAPWIVETDDDNFPAVTFWSKRVENQMANVVDQGWVNAYRYFTDAHIWPRGFDLEKITAGWPSALREEYVSCPIQQGLADANPDVDAIYRLTLPLPFSFEERKVPLAFGRGSWCPFNSQNTSWHKPSFLLTYLPSYCSFRMTDIWRSFIAQRIAWENDWHILFHNATVSQERNDHNLLHDFKDEVPGYLNNRRICSLLESLPLKRGVECIGDNLVTCYQMLTSEKIIGGEEMALLEAWILDMVNS